ncbi:hypothetical protein HDU78_009664, partial [Chytriomyces hyalinus]
NEEFESRFSLYRVEMDQKLQDLNASTAAVERARLDAESRLSKALEELSEQRTQIDKDHIEFLMDKSRLEDELERLKKSEESARNSCIHLGKEVSKYKQSLADSRTDYEKVILLESERIKTMEDLRRALEAAKSEVSAIQGKMEMQEATKTSQIQSLQTTITGLEEEVHALKEMSENASLQSQLDAVSDRLGSMHTGQSNLASNEENHTATIRNLRREKEILEQECSLAFQKTNRIQLQMQNLQRSLDDTRAALNQERQKGEMNSDSERLHRELMSKIDRVNVLNESNATLRSQNASLTRKIEHLESLIKVKEADLGPLRDRNAAINAENEGLKTRMETLLEENGRLVNRASQILGKYSRVDPAEHQSLKDQLAALSDKFGSSQALFDAEKKSLDDSKRALEEKVAIVTSQLASTKQALAKLSLEHSNLQANAADKSIEAALREEIENEKAKYKDTVARSNERMKKMIDRLKDSQAKNKELEDGLKTMETRLNDSAILQKVTSDLVAFPKPAVLSPVMTQPPRSEIVSKSEVTPGTVPPLQPPQSDSVVAPANVIAETPNGIELLPKSDLSTAMDVTSADGALVMDATSADTRLSNETPTALTNMAKINSELSKSHQAPVLETDAVIAGAAPDLSGGLPKRSREEESVNSIESEMVADAAIEEFNDGSQSKRQKTEEAEDGELYDEPVSTGSTFEVADTPMEERTQLDQSFVNQDSLVEDSGRQQPLQESVVDGASNDSSAPILSSEAAHAVVLDSTVELSAQTIVQSTMDPLQNANQPTVVSQQENAKNSDEKFVAEASIPGDAAITMAIPTPDISSVSGTGITAISAKDMTAIPSTSPTVNTLPEPVQSGKMTPAPIAQPAPAALAPATADIVKPAGPSAEDKTNLLKQKLKLMAMKKTSVSNIASSPSGGSNTSEPTAVGLPAAVAIPSNGNISGGLYDYSYFSLNGYDAFAYLIDLAVQTAVERVNNDPNLLPGAFLNIKRFSDCGKWKSGILEDWPFKTGGYASSIMAEEIIEDHPDVIGVVSLQFSGTARGVAEILSNAQIPYCSGAIGSPRYSNKNNYPYFWRAYGGSGVGSSIYQVLKYMRAGRVAIVYEKNNDLGYNTFQDIRKSLQRQNVLILCEFGMEDGSDAFMLDYIVESLRQSSARYVIVTGSNDFTAAFIHGMGSRGMVNDHQLYIGTNYPMPFENATLLYGPTYFELIRGFVLVSCANSDPSRPAFQKGRQELIQLSGYNFTDTDVIYNALDSFYDCAMNMVSGWNLLLSDNSILDLSTKKLNHLMSYSLFKNTGYHGMITDPFLLTEQGDLQNPWNACAMTGNEYECAPFGHTDVYMTEFIADENAASLIWRGSVKCHILYKF